MFIKGVPDKKVSDFEEKSFKSTKNFKQEAQRREDKSKPPPLHVDLARRPGYGNKGKRLLLRANFFEAFFRPGGNFFAYKMRIEPTPKIKRHIKQVFKQLVLNCEQIKGCLPATDDAQWIVTCEPLPFKSTFARCDPDEKEQFTVFYTCHFELQDGAPIPLQRVLQGLSNPDIHMKVSDEDYVVQLLNIALTSHAYADEGVEIIGKGRAKFFYVDDRIEKYNLTGGLEVLRGCITSLRPAANRFLLNINVSNTAFYQPIPLAAYVSEVLRENYNDLETLDRFVRHVKIELRYLSKILDDFKHEVWRIKTIWALASKEDERKYVRRGDGDRPPQVKAFGCGPDDVRFWYVEKGQPKSTGRYITVTEYFKKGE